MARRIKRTTDKTRLGSTLLGMKRGDAQPDR
jgi:hypothetical protein